MKGNITRVSGVSYAQFTAELFSEVMFDENLPSNSYIFIPDSSCKMDMVFCSIEIKPSLSFQMC